MKVYLWQQYEDGDVACVSVPNNFQIVEILIGQGFTQCDKAHHDKVDYYLTWVAGGKASPSFDEWMQTSDRIDHIGNVSPLEKYQDMKRYLVDEDEDET